MDDSSYWGKRVHSNLHVHGITNHLKTWSHMYYYTVYQCCVRIQSPSDSESPYLQQRNAYKKCTDYLLYLWRFTPLRFQYNSFVAGLCFLGTLSAVTHTGCHQKLFLKLNLTAFNWYISDKSVGLWSVIVSLLNSGGVF